MRASFLLFVVLPSAAAVMRLSSYHRETPKADEKVATASVSHKKRSHLKAFYVNLDKSPERAECISHQLSDNRIRSDRFAAATLPACPDWDFKCFKDAVFASNRDCFKGGAEFLSLLSHASKGNASTWEVASGILANWCSHKRLFQQLADNSSLSYGVKNFGWAVGKNMKSMLQLGNKKSQEEKPKESEMVYIIMEDDAILKPGFGDAIEDFVQNFHGDWDLVQVDTFGSVQGFDKIDEYKQKPVYRPSPVAEYFGLHCILVKESSVAKMNFAMEHMPAVPVDWFPKLLKLVPDMVSIAWNPDIVINPEVKMWAGYTGEDFLPKYCKKDILLSTIGGEAAATPSTIERLNGKSL